MEIKLKESLVSSLPYPASGQVFYRDAELKGFGLRVGTGSKVYIAEGKVDKKSVRVTIGRHGLFTSEQARAQAKSILGMIARGVNPNHVDKARKAKSATLAEVYQDYLIVRDELKPRTLYDYSRFMKTHFAEWNNKPIAEINQDLIERKHRQIGQKSEAQANLAMRFMRALFNFAITHYKDSAGNPAIADNPTKRLSLASSSSLVVRPQSLIKPHELPAWLKAVHILTTISNGSNKDAVKDYLLLLIFTGLRREQGLRLQWNDIDFEAKMLTIPDPKNQEPHILPLSTFLYYLLKKRHTENLEGSPFVFPGIGKNGYMNDPGKQMKIVMQASGVNFTLHDLRRTFIVIAESLDIPAYALKRLTNHKMRDDVTGYIIHDPEKLRVPMQKITDYLMKMTLGG